MALRFSNSTVDSISISIIIAEFSDRQVVGSEKMNASDKGADGVGIETRQRGSSP